MAGMSNNFIDFETWQLPSLTGLRSLCDFDLNLIGIDQILGCYTETPRCNLFDCTTSRCPIFTGLKTSGIFSSFSRITLTSQRVHGNGHSFMSLLADGAERHGTRNETMRNRFDRFHEGYIYGIALEIEAVAQKNRLRLTVDHCCKLLELFITTQSGRQLKSRYSLGIPSMEFSVFAKTVNTIMVEILLSIDICIGMELDNIPIYFFERYTSDFRCRTAKIAIDQILRNTNGLKQLSPPITTHRRDSHFGNYFQQSFIYGFQIIFFGRVIIELYLPIFYQPINNSKSHIRIDSTGPVTEQQRKMHYLPRFTSFYDNSRLYTQTFRYKMIMNSRNCQ